MSATDPWTSETRVELKPSEGPQDSVPAPAQEQPKPEHMNGHEPRYVQQDKGDLTTDDPKSSGEEPKPLDAPKSVKLPDPPGVERPTKGWPALKMRVIDRRNIEDRSRPGYLLIPAPNAAEQASRKERDFVATIRQSVEQECIDANQVGSGMVVFISTKGDGSKTTQSIWLSSGLCIETGTEVTLFDANFVAGTGAQRLGFGRGETLTERQLIDNYAMLSANHQALNRYLKNNRDRVRVLAAEAIIEGGRKLTGDEYAKVAELLRNNCDFLYVDMAQDATSEQCLALINMATVLVFVANVGEQDSLRKLGEGMETLRSFGFTDKVNRSVVSITNMPPDTEATDYRKYLNEVDVHNRVIREIPGHIGPLVGIHHDRAMANAQPVVFPSLQRETAQDIRLVNTAILKRMSRKPELKILKRTSTPSEGLVWPDSSSTHHPNLVPVNQS